MSSIFKSDKIKIIVVPACTDLNRGDQALTWESIDFFKKTFGDKNIDASVLDYGFTEDDKKNQSSQTKKRGYNVISNILQNPKRFFVGNSKKISMNFFDFLFTALVACMDLFKSLVVLFFPYKIIIAILFRDNEIKKSFQKIKESDAIVYKGGGFLHVYGRLGDLYYLWFGLYYALLGIRLNKKLIMMPNSIGPINGFFCRVFARLVLKKFDLLFVREKITKKYLDSIGIYNSRYFPDLGYFVSSDFSICENSKFDNILCDDALINRKLKIGITARPYRFPGSKNPKKNYEEYISSIADFCNSNAQLYFFNFIVQVRGPSAHENDLIAIKEIVGRLKKGTEYKIIDGDYNYIELMFFYSQLDFLIGTRFHSVIFSHVLGVPAIAIGYGGNKSFGIMEEVGLSDFVIPIDQINSKYISNVFQLLVDNKSDYNSKISGFLNLVNSEKYIIFDLISKAIKK